MNNKIWIVSEYYYPIVTSTGYYITEIAEYLALKGLDVNVISTGSKYNETGDYEFKVREVRNGVNIFRVKAGNIDKNNFVKRAYRLLKTSISLFVYTYKNVNKNDTLLVVTNPAFLILLIPIIKRLKKITYMLLVHDIFPENIAAIGGIKETSLIYKILKKFFDKAYSKTDTCISIGRDMSEVLNKKIKGKSDIKLIPNWADVDEVHPIGKYNTELYHSLFKQDKFIFQFAGNLGHVQGLDNILSAIELIDNPEIHFLFIGGGAKYEIINEFSTSHKNVTLIGFQDRTKQNDFLNACDVAIVTLSDGMYGLGVPSKSYNIMSAGKPIIMIGDKRSEISRCVIDYNLGWVVEPDNPEALKICIEEIYEKRENLKQIQDNSRQVAEKLFAKNVILEKYYRLFA
jgi:glycosyltransferase involved in cell wall biosynthesis